MASEAILPVTSLKNADTRLEPRFGAQDTAFLASILIVHGRGKVKAGRLDMSPFSGL